MRMLVPLLNEQFFSFIKTKSAPEYATQRTKDHLRCFNRLCDQLDAGQVDFDFLGECEARANIFPTLNWRYYL